MLTTGWNARLAKELKGLIRAVLMTQAKGAPVQFDRQLTIRDDALEVADEITLKPGARAAITGVVGMGGIGKTELAKIVGHRVAGRYRDGVLWADCGDERLTDMADHWATAYGVERLPGDDLLAKKASKAKLFMADWFSRVSGLRG